jgi:hypothetical protein
MAMSSSQSAPALETCANCAQKTASAFFTTVKKRRLCVLCADRAMKAEAAVKADIEDHRLHGGLGWLWKHIAYTAYASVGGLVLRYLIKSYLLTH